MRVSALLAVHRATRVNGSTARPEPAACAGRALASAVGLITAAALSCAPEIGPPTWPRIAASYSYATPGETLRSIATALSRRQEGTAHYLAGFADSTGPSTPAYHHQFDPEDLVFFQSACGCPAPGDWGLPQEHRFFLSFLDVRPGDQYTAVFDSLDSHPDPPPLDTLALLHRSYRVLATAPDGNTTIVIAVGLADLTFTKVAADRWLITRWVDHVDPNVGPNPADPYQVTLGRRRLESTR